MKTLSLPLRLNLISLAFTSSLALIIISVGGGMLYRQQAQNAVSRAEFAANELADRAERLLNLQLSFRDFLGFEEQCEEVAADDPLLGAAAVFDLSGNQLFSGSGQDLSRLSPVLSSLGGREAVVQSGTDWFVTHPIEPIRGQPEGYAAVLIDQGVFSTLVFKPIAILVLVSIFFSAAAVMVQQIIFRFTVGKPLARLVETADTIRATDYEPILLLGKSAGDDDIGRIYGALGRLMSRLNEANDRLIRQNGELDRIVRQRTEELLLTNEKLEMDIKSRKALEEELRTMAGTDTLTGLPNRFSLNGELERILVTAGRNGRMIAVLFIDLDHFKIINDTQGHQIGDRLLVGISKRLVSTVRRSDIVARLGGDEFMVILSDIGSRNNAAVVAEKILGMLQETLVMDGLKLHISASIGISVAPADGTEAHILMKNADTAMYTAKNNGRNNFQFFSSDMLEKVQKRLSIETRLRTALENGEFILHYQPQIQAGTLMLSGVEALLRWQPGGEDLVMPDRFIGIAEETGLIIPIGLWALEEACRQTVRWEKAGIRIDRIGVNLSPRQFGSPDLRKDVVDILERTGLAATRLQLEITESSLMKNPEETIDILATFRMMGIRLAIDDFGTGYSSFSYLKFLPVHHLKIDRSFISRMEESPDDERITAAIITLARGLNLCVIAEGVETETQLEFLTKQGCHEMQGYLFSRPLSAGDFASWHARSHTGLGVTNADTIPTA